MVSSTQAGREVGKGQWDMVHADVKWMTKENNYCNNNTCKRDIKKYKLSKGAETTDIADLA